MHAIASPVVLRGHLHSRTSRAVAGALVAFAGAALPAVALAGLLGDPELLTPPVLVSTLLVFAVLPAAAAWAVQRAAAARITLDRERMTLERRDLRVEVPRAAITRVAPWAVPLPGPGVTLALASPQRLAIADPTALLEALGQRAGRDHPVVVWAHARAQRPPWRWRHRLWKFVGFSFPVAAVLFRAHQWIAYGGTLGQWYMQGAGAWLRTLAVYWLVVAIDLVLWAALWRGVGEAAALAAAPIAPARAARVRWAVELACRVAYYAGVPALLAARFLA